jgi:hypothetical protein
MLEPTTSDSVACKQFVDALQIHWRTTKPQCLEAEPLDLYGHLRSCGECALPDAVLA